MAKTATSDSDCDVRMPGALPLRVVTGYPPDEKRCASVVGDWNPIASDVQCSPTSEDERSAGIPSTSDLEPLENPQSPAIDLAIQTLSTHEDWLMQHESITTLRRCIVHHSTLLTDSHLLRLVPALAIACDNLRSALSKNALLALSECFEYLDAHRCVTFLRPTDASAIVPLVDVLLRRATCEKRFLRDAANEAVDNLIMFLASSELVVSVTYYAASKNAKIVAIASRIMAQSCARLQALKAWDVDQFTSAHMHPVYQVLAKFRDGKESAARNESAACLKLLGDALGKELFHATLAAAMPTQNHNVQSIMIEVFPSPDAAPQVLNRRGSLRDRMQLHQQMQQVNLS